MSSARTLLFPLRGCTVPFWDFVGLRNGPPPNLHYFLLLLSFQFLFPSLQYPLNLLGFLLDHLIEFLSCYSSEVGPQFDRNRKDGCDLLLTKHRCCFLCCV